MVISFEKYDLLRYFVKLRLFFFDVKHILSLFLFFVGSIYSQLYALTNKIDTIHFVELHGYEIIIRNNEVFFNKKGFQNTFFDTRKKVIYYYPDIFFIEKTYLNINGLDSITTKSVKYDTIQETPISTLTYVYDEHERVISIKEERWMNNAWEFWSKKTYQYIKKDIRKDNYGVLEEVYFDKKRRKVYDKNEYKIMKGKTKKKVTNLVVDIEEILKIASKEVLKYKESRRTVKNCRRTVKNRLIFYFNNKQMILIIELFEARDLDRLAIITTNNIELAEKIYFKLM
jgi:hypothetical protein